MKTTRAIIISSTIISASIFAHLGYTVAKDHTVKQEQERSVKASADAERRSQSKQAWKYAIGIAEDIKPKEYMLTGTELVRELDDWLDARKTGTETDIRESLVYANAFNLADVEWHDARRATVRGVLQVRFEGQSTSDPLSVFNWKRNVAFESDGVDNWWSEGKPDFIRVGPIAKQSEEQRIVILADKLLWRMQRQ
jgi:hypothetical protein